MQVSLFRYSAHRCLVVAASALIALGITQPAAAQSSSHAARELDLVPGMGEAPQPEHDDAHPYTAAGGAAMGVSGVASLLVGTLLLGAQNARDHDVGEALFVPVAGPWISLGLLSQMRGNHPVELTILAIDGVAQAVGTTLLLYGIAHPEPAGINHLPSVRVSRWGVIPWATPTGAGLAFAVSVF